MNEHDAGKLPADKIAALRREYTLHGLRKSELAPDPMSQFARWFADALAVQPDDPNAMTLATATPDGRPSARIVLLKGFDAGGFLFFTNYESRKGHELDANPRAALNFHWPALERQICVTGAVAKVSREVSAEYFQSRPIGSQFGAWASTQSEIIPDRVWLETRIEEMHAKFPGKVPLPPSWGGYRLAPESVEFWQGRPNRLHDRLLYKRQAEGGWKIDRLSP